jgi:hypothetical protein
MKILYEVGDVIYFKEFAFRNKGGGTGLSNWEYNEKFITPGNGIITEAWCDDECGWRFHCRAISDSLKSYLERNAEDDIVFVSEFDIIP